jgi:hypothetical protein
MPGSSSATWIPNGAASIARDSSSASSAHLEAWYAAPGGRTRRPTTLDTNSTWPCPRARTPGSTARAARRAPIVLRSSSSASIPGGVASTAA